MELVFYTCPIDSIADRVTVLRDGQFVATNRVTELEIAKVVQLMVGRNIDEVQRTESQTKREAVLVVEQLTRREAFKDLTFSALPDALKDTTR
jgi:ABC-type sugar transport system ATPase subunit